MLSAASLDETRVMSSAAAFSVKVETKRRSGGIPFSEIR